jgi:hypothetical protein
VTLALFQRPRVARRPVQVSLIAAALALVATACGPTQGTDAGDAAVDSAPSDVPVVCVFTDGGTPQTLDTVYALVLSRRCGTAGTCHFNSAEPPAGLDMTTLAVARTRLVGGPAATGGFCMPGGVTTRVVPGNLDDSMLWRRILGTTCAERMPIGAPPLSCADQQLIRDWILGGAR